MGKTIRRFNRREVPKNKPYKESKVNIDKYKGISSEDLDEFYDDDDFDEYEE